MEPAKPTVLIVDDEPDALELLTFHLKAAGCEVMSAADGEEALRKARTLVPDLIILDLMLPDMTGWELCAMVRTLADPQLSTTPIIMVTSRATEGERKIGEQVGANEFLLKPLRLPQVLDVVKRYLNA